MSTSSVNPRRIAVAAGYGALAIGLPYGAATYASPDSAWALMALCVCGLGVAGYRRTPTIGFLPASSESQQARPRFSKAAFGRPLHFWLTRRKGKEEAAPLI